MKWAQLPTNDHNCPLSKSMNDKEHTHPWPPPTTTQNEYDCPWTTTAEPLTTWDVHHNNPWTTTTHHTKWARLPMNDMNCPPSRQNPSCPQTTTMMHKQLPIAHKSPPAMRSTHSNHPPRMTTHHDKKRAQPHMAPMNNSTKWAQMTTTAYHQPTSNEECPLQLPTNDNHPPWHETGMTTHKQRQLHALKTPKWRGAHLNHSWTMTAHHTKHAWLPLHQPGALMVSMSLDLLVATIFMFDSWCMYYFCGVLTSVFTAFLCVFGYYWLFILPYVLLLFLLDIKPPGWLKIALISH